MSRPTSGPFEKTSGWLDWYDGPATPAFVLPAGAVDAHCHVFGPGGEYPYAPERKYTPCDASRTIVRVWSRRPSGPHERLHSVMLVHSLTTQSSGHGQLLQVTFSKRFGQSRPPNCGGVRTTRTRSCWPPPQVAEQSP